MDGHGVDGGDEVRAKGKVTWKGATGGWDRKRQSMETIAKAAIVTTSKYGSPLQLNMNPIVTTCT
ncbi:hypothetical protein CCR75_004127 [Bremia lactucae]|uniref:Uncharacterized protein n=1 Tax=Bremia lactucae TaxID=4779 RepID=A0A976ICZ4_BRELC|nr:hypothetical protein CCR75_004127 [Bremia lactucae]